MIGNIGNFRCDLGTYLHIVPIIGADLAPKKRCFEEVVHSSSTKVSPTVDCMQRFIPDTLRGRGGDTLNRVLGVHLQKNWTPCDPYSGPTQRDVGPETGPKAPSSFARRYDPEHEF